MKNKILLISCLGLIFIVINGCSSFKGIGSDLGEGLMDQAKTNVDTVGYEFVKGLRESLTNEESQKQLQNFIDSIITQAGSSANMQAVKLRDSLLNDYMNKWAKKVVEDAVQSFNNSLLDDKTVARLQKQIDILLSDVGTGILNDSTMLRVAALRDTLLGEKTNQLISAVLDSALTTLSFRLRNDINPHLRENLSFVEKNATWLLILIGAIALAITAFIWNRKQKYLKLTKLLTYQISELPEPEEKEILKNNISRNAKEIGIESELRELLEKSGLLHLDKK